MKKIFEEGVTEKELISLLENTKDEIRRRERDGSCCGDDHCGQEEENLYFDRSIIEPICEKIDEAIKICNQCQHI